MYDTNDAWCVLVDQVLYERSAFLYVGRFPQRKAGRGIRYI